MKIEENRVCQLMQEISDSAGESIWTVVVLFYLLILNLASYSMTTFVLQQIWPMILKSFAARASIPWLFDALLM